MPQMLPGDPIFIPGSKAEKKFPISSPLLILITLIIVAFLIYYTYRSIKNTVPKPLEFPVDTDIVDIGTLINLDIDGQCCIPPSQVNTTSRWIYSPSAGYTFSVDKTKPSVVCQGLTGLNLSTCLSYVTDANGDGKPLAHKGIQIYYPFSVGNAGTTCSSYGSC